MTQVATLPPREAPVAAGTPDDHGHGIGRRPSRAGSGWPVPSVARILVVAVAVTLLALICWLKLGEPGRVLFAAAQHLFGLFVYALPLVPTLTLVRPAAGCGPTGRRCV